MAKALSPLDRWALNHRPTRHCPGWAPVLTAAFVHLLEWRDRALPMALVEGFQVVGAIPASRIHRPLDTEVRSNEALRSELLGPSAIRYIDSLEADVRIHPHAEDILASIQEEISLGLARPLESRQQVDEIFGRGHWRPLPRHIVYQDDKARPIDDAKAGGHNRSTDCAETIVCITSEWPAIAWRAYLRKIRDLQPAEPLPEWCKPSTATDDMWKGFRQNHPTREDECFCIITFVHPHTHQRVYSRLRGLPFGMGSVVNQFNRMPHLKTAVLRRLLGLMACHYFDDELLIDSTHCAGASKTLALRLAALLGIRYSPNKRQPMSTWTIFLGHTYDWSQVASSGAATFGIKATTQAKATRLIVEHISTNSMSPAEASKLRGLLMWLDTGLTGRPCRGAMAALVARQYWERPPSHALSDSLRQALAYIHAAICLLPPRALSLLHTEAPQTVIYTDAATNTPALRVGILVIPPTGPRYCSVLDVPTAVVDQWELRTTYIGQGELIAGPLALWIYQDLLHNADATWYIDNTSAAAALIKGASPQQDSSDLAMLAALRAAVLGCRVWVEWVPTHQNPADPLSRGGYADPHVARQVRTGHWLPRQLGTDR